MPSWPTIRADVADVRNATKIISDSTTWHICSINDQLGNNGKWLTQLIYKVMPEYAEARQQIDRVFVSKPPALDPENPV